MVLSPEGNGLHEVAEMTELTGEGQVTKVAREERTKIGRRNH